MSKNRPRVLLLEDEWIVAADLQDALENAGCEVLGPATTVAHALDLLGQSKPTAAVLDVQLVGEKSFPVAETLLKQGTPFVFVSGFTVFDLPERFRSCVLLPKPCNPDRVLQALGLASPRAGAI